MFLETMDGEIINSAYLRSISLVTGETNDGETGWGIAGYFAPVDRLEGEESVQLGVYQSEKDANADFELFQNALIAERRYFRFGKIYES